MNRTMLATLVAIPVATGVHAQVEEHEYAIPYGSGLREVDLDIAPYVPATPLHALTRAEITVEGYTRTRFTTTEPFDGFITISVKHTFFVLAEFDNGTDFASYDFSAGPQNFSVNNAHPWFTIPFTMSSLFLFSPDYEAGNPEFDRFVGTDPIPLHLMLEGRTDVQYPPTPDHIGVVTGADWIVRVKYTYVPAPGGLALVGIGAGCLLRRRR